MKHKHKRHRAISRIHKKFRNLAAAVAGAAILSGAMLPGIPAATVHAAANTTTGTPPIEATQQINQERPAADNKVSLNAKNAPPKYEKVLSVKATAYAPGPHDNDQWGNKTYTGEQIRPGIIAVDPDVIPLGSQVYIQYPNGHGEYAVASDTGGAIKGNRIDVAKWTVNEAEDFGIQHVKVFVVSTPEKA
ncbi:hypothetical protein SDC9_13565 [bioreactor metagenome]|uniref:3D domain-containing protein n=1 Tax=bioreactor metagenome TaxID=1076179 RepID=A0A644TNL8_9ZZZZ